MESDAKSPETLLLVDDDPLALRALERCLRLDKYDVRVASSGAEALEILESNNIAAILCDQKMPEMLGTELLSKALEISPNSARILITGNPDMETLVTAVNVGQISQFVAKPWKEAFLRQTVRAAVEKYQLIKENQELQRQVVKQHQNLKQAHDSLQQDLHIGAQVHDVLLIGQVPKELPEAHLEVLTHPSKEIDGDFHEFYQPSEHVLDVVLGDVMGKGIPAALVGTAVKAQMMRCAKPLNPMQSCAGQGPWLPHVLTPAEILKEVQAELAQNLIDLEFFVTLFYGRFDFTHRRFTYVDCGSTKPIIYRPDDQSVAFLGGPNFPLGMVATDNYVEKSVSFEPGDIFLFYSDGVTEARNPDNQLYGEDRLVDILKNYGRCQPKALLHLIEQSALKWDRSEQLDDDVTLMSITIDKEWQPSQLLRREAKFHSDLAQLEAVRQFVANVCALSPDGLDPCCEQLQLALNEAFANVVEHGYDNESDREIKIRGEVCHDKIVFTLLDRGQAFRPSDIQEPSLAGDRSGGFGLYIMRQVADDLSYLPKASDTGWNQLTLSKNFQIQGANMQYSHAKQDDILVVTLESPNLDAKDAPGFKESIQTLITEEQKHKVVFDLKELQFIDSSGLGAFLSVLRHVNNKGGDLRLASPTKPIKTMLEIVRMHKLFEIFNSADEAVKSF